jgi:hypothetical protein
LTLNLRNFTVPAFIKAIDYDAEEPNNIVRYEIIHGNYENKFILNEITGQLMLREPLTKRNKRQTNTKSDPEVYVLTARAFDLGVPVRYSTCTIRVYPPESQKRAISFLVPGYSPDKASLEQSLSDLTGGRVEVLDIKPYLDSSNTGSSSGVQREEKSIVTATIIYENNKVVDLAEVQKRLGHKTNEGIVVHDEVVNLP